MAISPGEHLELAAKDDADIGFAEVAWSPDSTRVAIYVYLTYRKGILIGYDFTAKQSLPADVVQPLIEATIRSRYSLPLDYLRDYNGELERWSAAVGRAIFWPGGRVEKPVILSYVSAQQGN